MDGGGVFRPADFAGVHVSESALLRRAQIPRSRWDAAIEESGKAVRRVVGPDGEPMIAGSRAFELTSAAMKRGDARATQVFESLLAREGAVLRREGKAWFPAGRPAAPAADAVRGAADVAADDAASATKAAKAPERRGSFGLGAVRTRGAGIVSAITGALHAKRMPLVGGAGAALLVGGIGIALATRKTDPVVGGGDAPPADGSGAVDGAGDAAPAPAEGTEEVVDLEELAKARTKAAEVAFEQVGVTDTADGKTLDEQVKAYMESSPGVSPGVHVDWRADFVGWVWREAGMPLGDQGAGAFSVDSLANWASNVGAWSDGKPTFNEDDPDAEIGRIVVLSDEYDEPTDIGIIVKADAETLEIVQGNRASGTRIDEGSEAGFVGRAIVRRDDPIVLGTIDPPTAVANAKRAEAEAAKAAAAAAEAERARAAEEAERQRKAEAEGAGKPINGVAPPEASADHPTPQQMEQYLDWAVAQYAESPDQQRIVSNVIRNLMAGESGFKINSMNLWDRAAVEWRTPSYGPFQYLKPTYDELQPQAQRANEKAWSHMGGVKFSDWRQQALTTAWALTRPPTEFSRNNNGWSGQHGQYWSRWYALRDMVGRGEDPITSTAWRDKLYSTQIDAPISNSVVYPAPWKREGRTLTEEELRKIADTGTVDFQLPPSPEWTG